MLVYLDQYSEDHVLGLQVTVLQIQKLPRKDRSIKVRGMSAVQTQTHTHITGGT